MSKIHVLITFHDHQHHSCSPIGLRVLFNVLFAHFFLPSCASCSLNMCAFVGLVLQQLLVISRVSRELFFPQFLVQLFASNSILPNICLFLLHFFQRNYRPILVRLVPNPIGFRIVYRRLKR